MHKAKEKFLNARKTREEVAEKGKKIVEEKLKGNTYFTNLLENRKKIKELYEKRYKLETELYNLKREIEKTEQEEAYQKGLQNWNNVITINSFKHEYTQNPYYNFYLDYWQLFSPLVDIRINLKERRELKVWKFEVTSNIKNIKNLYAENITTDVVKFKSKDEALKLVEDLKIKLFNQYAEDFNKLNKSIKLATEVKKSFEGIERAYLPNDLQCILAKVYN